MKPQSSSSTDTFSALFFGTAALFLFVFDVANPGRDRTACWEWEGKGRMMEEMLKNETKRGLTFRFSNLLRRIWVTFIHVCPFFSHYFPQKLSFNIQQRKVSMTQFFFMASSRFGFFSSPAAAQTTQKGKSLASWRLPAQPAALTIPEKQFLEPNQSSELHSVFKVMKVNCLLICVSFILVNSIKNPKNEKSCHFIIETTASFWSLCSSY